MRAGLLAALLLLTPGALFSADKAVAVVVEHGPVLPHDAVARLRVTITPSSHNRGAWVAIEADGYAGAHYEQLDAASPKTRWVEFKDLPDGDYTAWVRVMHDQGSDTSVSTPFTVGATIEGCDACQ